MTARRSLRAPAVALFLAAAVAVAGCGPGKKPTGTVSGKVTYNGQPLTLGSVNFLSTAGVGGQGLIDGSGAYTVDGPLDVGEYKVYLNPPVPGQFAPGTKAPPAAKFNVQPKHQQPGTSGMAKTVKEGPNVIDIDFKD